jgi:hypothetical protein
VTKLLQRLHDERAAPLRAYRLPSIQTCSTSTVSSMVAKAIPPSMFS